MTDYTDWTRTPIRFEDVKKGDVIEGEQMGDNNLSRSLSPTVVSAVDDADGHRKIQLPTAWRLPETDVFYGNWTLRKLTPPTPQWPEMAPLTALGQMAEGLIDGQAASVLASARFGGGLCFEVQVGDRFNFGHNEWDDILAVFDPGTLHPITAEPIVLSDEQVRMLPAETWLINGGDEWCTANSAWTFMEDAPFSLIHYPKEK